MAEGRLEDQTLEDSLVEVEGLAVGQEARSWRAWTWPEAEDDISTAHFTSQIIWSKRRIRG